MPNIPAKVFEYLSFKKPILFIGNVDSDVYKLIKPTGLLIHVVAGICLKTEIAKAKPTLRFSFDDFERKKQLELLEGVLHEIGTQDIKNS